ncbi:MAG: 50S ribosomal protein L11 methyltransferase [Oscillospiraceae bacterium]|nr:50S ribosomal protein L11 methyltransferase [Oscillospiraceae bacterium]
MASWNEVIVSIASSDLERAAAIATMVAPGGIYIEDYSDMLTVIPTVDHYDYISESLLMADKNQSCLHIYFENHNTLSSSLSFVEQQLNSEQIPYTTLIKTVNEEDWQESWKQYFHAMKLTDRIVVCPSWEEYQPQCDEILLLMDPGMSFGTGQHESTQLALQLLENCKPKGMTVLDIGTGSGILAISALKLGAESAVGVDISTVAVTAANENAERNSVKDRFDCICADISDPKHNDLFEINFDLIISNVVADFHILMIQNYANWLKIGGKLIISGIITAQLQQVISVFGQTGFEILGSESRNDWSCILLQKIRQNGKEI